MGSGAVRSAIGPIGEISQQLQGALATLERLQSVAEEQTDMIIRLAVERRQLGRKLEAVEAELYVTRADLHRCVTQNDGLSSSG